MHTSRTVKAGNKPVLRSLNNRRMVRASPSKLLLYILFYPLLLVHEKGLQTQWFAGLWLCLCTKTQVWNPRMKRWAEMGNSEELPFVVWVAGRRKDAGVQSKMPKAGSRWRFEQLLVVDGKADLKIAAILERNWLELAQTSDFSDFNDFSYIDQSLYLDVGYLWEKHVFQFMRLLWVLVVDFQA